MKILYALVFVVCSRAVAQPFQPDMKVFADRRQEFIGQMEPGSVAVFPSKPLALRNLDVHHDYRQESNFYYISGFEEPESILLLNPSHSRYKYVMYVRDKNVRREIYDGSEAGPAGAMRDFGADTALYVSDFRKTINMFIEHDRSIYYTFGINPKFDDTMKEIVIEKRAGGNWPVIDPSTILAEMRLIKKPADFAMGLQRAIDISAQAHIEAMKSIEPGLYEYEIQGVFEYVFRKMGSPRNGYACIVGSGPNSGVLHYRASSRMMHDGEVILMDCAAEYGNYTSDITRTVPVNGRFSKEQRTIYQLVLDAQNAGIRMVKPGLEKAALDREIDEVLSTGLVKLGFIKDKKDFKLFTIHGYAHWLGLDVHDVGAYAIEGKSRNLKPGMLFTVEPGIYVRSDVFERMKHAGYSDEDIARIRPKVEPYMHIGIRIEDNILVTETGYRDLTARVPKEIADIEALMKEPGIAQRNRR